MLIKRLNFYKIAQILKKNLRKVTLNFFSWLKLAGQFLIASCVDLYSIFSCVKNVSAPFCKIRFFEFKVTLKIRNLQEKRSLISFFERFKFI